MKEFPCDLGRVGGFAGPGAKRQHDALVALGQRLPCRVVAALLVTAQVPIAAIRLKVYGSEKLRPSVVANGKVVSGSDSVVMSV